MPSTIPYWVAPKELAPTDLDGKTIEVMGSGTAKMRVHYEQTDGQMQVDLLIGVPDIAGFYPFILHLTQEEIWSIERHPLADAGKLDFILSFE